MSLVAHVLICKCAEVGILNLEYYETFVYFCFQLLKNSFNWESISWLTNKKFIFSVKVNKKKDLVIFEIQACNFGAFANQLMSYTGNKTKHKI
jgi:hypothetical protein